MIEDFRTQEKVVKKSAVKLSEARRRVNELSDAIKNTRNPTRKMRAEFEKARIAAARLEDKHTRNRKTLHGLMTQMQQSGVKVGDLAGEQRRLAGALDRGTTAAGRQIERMKRLGIMQDKIVSGRERMDRSLSRAANISFVGGASSQVGRRIVTGLSNPIRQAIRFESAMADVKKVVDFESPDSFKKMSADILDLSARIPIAAEGLAAIVAAGGQSSIPRDQLLEFAEMAAKVGVAFDISADRAGESMARIKTAMGLSLRQSGSLFDAMNHLSNNSAARADQTLDFINRAGAAGKTFGFDPTETLAVGAAMIAAGAGADTAATSFRNMGRALTRGESATARQTAAMRKLGLDSSDVAKGMQADAVGTTSDVLRRLNELPEHIRASTMSDLFGDEARELTKLLNNMQLMPEMLALVAKEQNYLGSANEEYETRSNTMENQLTLLNSKLTELSVTIGEQVFPEIKRLATSVSETLSGIVTWTKAHPKLTKYLLASGLARGGLAVAAGALLTTAAALVGTMAVLRFGIVGLGAKAVFAAGDLVGIGAGLRGLSRLPKFALSKLVTPLKWTASLLPAVSWSGLVGRSNKFGMTKHGWGRLITPIKWFGRGALRLIPVIGWAVMAAEIGMFAWKYLGLNKLPWRDWIDTIDWANWFTFRWKDLLPSWDWMDIIPEFNVVERLVFGKPSPSGLSEDPKDRAAAARRGQSLGYGRPVDQVGKPRARGGPVMAGVPHLVNEATRDTEYFIPSRSGGILNVPQMQSAVRQHLARFGGNAGRLGMAGQAVRAASMAALAVPSITMPAAAQMAPQPGSGGSNARVEINGGIHIAVPSGVTDPQAIADIVAEQIGNRVSATLAASFSD